MRRLLFFTAGVFMLSCIAYCCAWILELPLLKHILGFPYEFRIITLTPIIEESLKILPFLLTVYFLHRYRGIEITNLENIGVLFFIGCGFGFFEGVFSHHKSGIFLFQNILIHGGMTGFSGFFSTGILLSILLHVITNSIVFGLSDLWKGFVIVSFFIGVLFYKELRGVTLQENE